MNATGSADHDAPLPRVASVSKPTPKPRPRSLVVEVDSNTVAKVPGTAERPVAPPRSKSKSSKGGIEVGSQKDHTIKAPKADAPNRMDLDFSSLVNPKPRPVASELVGQQRVSPSFSENESVAVTDVSSNLQDIETSEKEIKGSEVEPSKAKPKKPLPPPIPRRIDLD